MGARPPSGFSPQSRKASRTTSTFSLGIAAQYPRLVCAPVSWKVTVRHGSRVGREKFDSLDEAIDEARRRVEQIRREGGLPSISVFRTHTPDQRVHARIEISGPGLIRAPEGGIDVMGDGNAIAYTGTVRREPIHADSLDDAFERLRDALAR
jgi:hypothetical protein